MSSDIRSLVKEMVDNLCIRPSADQKPFHLSTKIESGDLSIKSIYLHKETRHSVHDYKDILLHLLEVHELDLVSQPEPKVDYRATLPPGPDTTSPGCKIWWEVSLSSILAADTFKQNEELELGDLASWTPETVCKNSVKDLSYVTRDLVQQIDAVGSLNKGLKGATGTKTSDEQQFW